MKNFESTSKSTKGMVLIPAGYFMMGSPTGVGGVDEGPRHKVWVDAFYIDPTKVSFEQYDKYCDETGSEKPGDEGWGRGTRPVININWNNADAYCRWAGKRLPTEAEWEKAARAGTDTKWYWGDDEKPITDYVWYEANSNNITHPVGEKKANAFKLYDMGGNTWEWCSDWYGNKYYAVSAERNPKGPESGLLRVLRGGSWNYYADNARAAYRNGDVPESGYGNGCRCVQTP